MARPKANNIGKGTMKSNTMMSNNYAPMSNEEMQENKKKNSN